ncbi:MAG TPA: SdpI family protein [Pirellulales bacterium]|nr:SdpI family protein [Pirellulales bacterium]
MVTRAQLYWLLFLLAADTVAGAIAYPFLPPRSPIHWNLRGEVDGYGGPLEVALVFPLILLFAAGLPLAIACIPSVAASIRRSVPVVGRMLIAAVTILLVIHGLVLLNAFGRPVDVSLGCLVTIGLLLAVLGNWMGKLRRNPIAGIRTPWTLKSDVVWERTHRYGGRLMVAIGLASLLAALVCPPWVAVAVLTLGVFVLLVWSFVYSWQLYRRLGSGQPAA